MQTAKKYADILKTMRAQGWEVGIEDVAGGTFYMVYPGRMLGVWLDDTTCALFDAFYRKGFKDGFQRGAYEEMTQEDVEPVARDPNAPAQHFGIVSLYNVDGTKATYPGYEDQSVSFTQEGDYWRSNLQQIMFPANQGDDAVTLGFACWTCPTCPHSPVTIPMLPIPIYVAKGTAPALNDMRFQVENSDNAPLLHHPV